MYSIVTNLKISNFIKRSRYFKINLGLASTLVDRTGERKNNENDRFAFHYSSIYNTFIYAQGHVGDIMIYVDHYIKEDLLALYINHEEFIFNFDEKIMNEKGPDFYLGKLLKELKEKNEERVKEAEEKKILDKEKIGNSDIVMNNPGAVTYSDLQAYLEKKRNERYSS
jgi:hypothetical protein